MRAVIQRVREASVEINHSETRSIAAGLMVLLAIEESDTPEDIEWLSGKIVSLREILLVSQFTLFASTRKGNRPSYSRSARPEFAIPVYKQFIARLNQDLGKQVQTGEFGADMVVTLANDGPVTIIIDSKLRE
jgi:D-tyrosyl-tRNA(Tyr) deacylase